MKKLDIKGIFTRPRKLLLHPETEWQVIGRENIEGIELFKNFLVPLSMLSSVCAILLRLLSTSPLYAIGTGIILFMASVVGSYIAYRVTREYLSNKVAEANRMALSPCRVQLGRLHPVPLPFQWILGRIYIPTHGNM